MLKEVGVEEGGEEREGWRIVVEGYTHWRCGLMGGLQLQL